MAERALDHTSRVLKKKFTVQAAGTVTKGMSVKLGTLATECLDAGANGKAVGIALTSQVAGESVTVALFGDVIQVLVGTGGATHGEHAIRVADGYTNQTLGGGTTVKYIEGIFLQTGVAADYVGLMLLRFAAGAA